MIFIDQLYMSGVVNLVTINIFGHRNIYNKDLFQKYFKKITELNCVNVICTQEDNSILSYQEPMHCDNNDCYGCDINGEHHSYIGNYFPGFEKISLTLLDENEPRINNDVNILTTVGGYHTYDVLNNKYNKCKYNKYKYKNK